MDVLSLAGILLALLAILAGNFLEGGNLLSLANPSAALIVIGGTIGAALLQTPITRLHQSIKMLRWVFVPPQIDFAGGQKQIHRWASVARREGLLGIENQVDQEQDGFVRKGLEMLVDGYEPQAIKETLINDRLLFESQAIDAACVFEAMGGYAPTIGILGAVLGLIQVMSHLADPSQLGHGIATAFVATIYGVGIANLILLPIAQKLKGIVQRQAVYQEMYIEGLVAIASGEIPRSIGVKLAGYGAA